MNNLLEQSASQRPPRCATTTSSAISRRRQRLACRRAARSRRPSPSRTGSRPSPSSTHWHGSATSRTTIPSCGLPTTAASSASRRTRPRHHDQRLHLRRQGRCPGRLRRLNAERPRVVSGHGRPLRGRGRTTDGAITCHARGKKSETASSATGCAGSRSGDEGVIENVLPRRNLLHRQDAWKVKSFAANIDQLLFVVAAEPVFSESQLARALIAAEAAGIPSRMVLNKQDLPGFAGGRGAARALRRRSASRCSASP